MIQGYVFVFMNPDGSETTRSYAPGALVQVGQEMKAQADIVVGDTIQFENALRKVDEVRLVIFQGPA